MTAEDQAAEIGREFARLMEAESARVPADLDGPAPEPESLLFRSRRGYAIKL